MLRELDKGPQPKTKEMPRYEGAFIPIDNINVLNQPRHKFENIELLAQDIARKNILNPLTVAELDAGQAQDYLDTINEIWQAQHTLEELRPTDGKGTYYILIAGERRFRACKHLDSRGCFDCQEHYGAGPCYQRHFGNRNVEVRLMRNFDALEAISTQASENTHMRVPPEEEALFYDKFYRVKRKLDPNYSVAHFARDVGRSPDTITAAVRFCRLPQEIQDFVRNETLSYGIAVELERARENLNLDEAGLDFWTVKAIISRVTVPEFHKMVSGEIERQRNNQSVLGLFSQIQEEDMRKTYFKRVVAREMINGIWQFINYFQKVEGLFEEGKLGSNDSPFSLRSPLRVYKTMISLEKRLLPHFRGLLTDAELEEAESVIDESDSLISLTESLIHAHENTDIATLIN